MKAGIIAIAALLTLAACTEAITLRHPETGAEATCGPYVNTWTTPLREAQCIQDFKEQGYVRVAR